MGFKLNVFEPRNWVGSGTLVDGADVLTLPFCGKWDEVATYYANLRKKFPVPPNTSPQPQQNQANGASIVDGQVLDAAATSRLQICGIVPRPGRYWEVACIPCSQTTRIFLAGTTPAAAVGVPNPVHPSAFSHPISPSAEPSPPTLPAPQQPAFSSTAARSTPLMFRGSDGQRFNYVGGHDSTGNCVNLWAERGK
jgi:hypothetical protein